MSFFRGKYPEQVFPSNAKHRPRPRRQPRPRQQPWQRPRQRPRHRPRHRAPAAAAAPTPAPAVTQAKPESLGSHFKIGFFHLGCPSRIPASQKKPKAGFFPFIESMGTFRGDDNIKGRGTRNQTLGNICIDLALAVYSKRKLS